MKLAQQAEHNSEVHLPEYLHRFAYIFEEQAAEQMLSSQPYDHAINLKSDFVLKDCKVYPLSLIEQEHLDKFLNDNLCKDYIWLSSHHSNIYQVLIANCCRLIHWMYFYIWLGTVVAATTGLWR